MTNEIFQWIVVGFLWIFGILAAKILDGINDTRKTQNAILDLLHRRLNSTRDHDDRGL